MPSNMIRSKQKEHAYDETTNDNGLLALVVLHLLGM